jgi:hypothetical protein
VRDTTDAAALVMAAVKSIDRAERAPGSAGLSQERARSLPELRAFLDLPDDMLRECLITAAHADSRIGTRLVYIIAGHLTGKGSRLLAADVAAALSPPLPQPVARRPWPNDDEVARALAPLIEGAWRDCDSRGRAGLAPLLARTAAGIRDSTLAARFRRLVTSLDRITYELLDDSDEVGPALRAVLEDNAQPDSACGAVLNLLAGFPATGRPGKTWTRDAEVVQKEVTGLSRLLGALLDAAIGADDHETVHGSTSYVTGANEAVLCGLAVLSGHAASTGAPELLPRLRKLALKAIVMIGWGQPRSLRLANHCVQAIADAGLAASVTELLRVERGTRHGALLRQARKSVDALAATRGMERDELLERAVEDHGLSADGTRSVSLASGWTAVLSAGSRTAQAEYHDADGTARKSLPAPVKQASTEALAALQRDLKGVRATIGNERSRLDAQLAAGRSWDAASWRELYLDHPVTGRLARALIWVFRDADGAEIAGIPLDEAPAPAPDGGPAVLTSGGGSIPLPGHGEVRLWHPVSAGAGEVRTWRQLLTDREIMQPVKQAFREVYVVTPAELETRDYSNRFAGHVLRQEQARALMKGRGWSAVPLAAWDDGIYHGVGRREFERDGLRAEFFFDPASEDHFTGNSLYTYAASDQVRFFSAETDAAISLAEVPPLVFSEAMRDVDLFIGVSSIGADPEWNDRGEGRRFGDYWYRFGFGELSAGAVVRREVLERLLPRLAIADRCTLAARYLVVRGDLRAYKIHLGSGNILMSPNDQYLCIVAVRDGQAGKLFLPFDDDPLLSMILSKAFLLAADAKITDPSITRQIGGQ